METTRVALVLIGYRRQDALTACLRHRLVVAKPRQGSEVRDLIAPPAYNYVACDCCGSRWNDESPGIGSSPVPEARILTRLLYRQQPVTALCGLTPVGALALRWPVCKKLMTV